MQLTNSQNMVVEKLFDAYLENQNEIISFKAPTGSGKTFMAASFISKVLQNNQNRKKIMFVIATISSAELPKSFADKLEKYKKYLPFKNFEVEHRVSPSSTQTKIEVVQGFDLQENKVLIFGTSSFGKKKIFSEQGILDNFIEETKNSNWEIIYLRDEAHRGTALSKSEEQEMKTIDSKLRGIAAFTIQMTATPKGDYPIIELKESEMKNDGVSLLKETPMVPYLKNDLESDNAESFDVLKIAIQQFKEEIKPSYQKLEQAEGIYIRPAMLIQVSSKYQGKEEIFDQNMLKIEKILTDSGLNYLKYFSEEKSSGNVKAPATLEEASKIDSIYDVIIFKIGPATGWDIPRACMLVQLRSVCSEILNIQTLGRIKRNPFPDLRINEISNKYYLYSDYQESTRELEGYKLKDKFIKKSVFKGLIEKDQKHSLLLQDYLNRVRDEILTNKLFWEVAKKKAKSSELVDNDSIQRFKTSKLSNELISKNYLKNKIQLKIYINEKIKKFPIIFCSEFLELIDKFSAIQKIDVDIILYTLYSDYLNELKGILNESYEDNYKDEKHEVVSGKLQQFYQIWSDNKNQNKISSLEKYDNYGYQLVKLIKENRNIQFLDSYPELCFLDDFLKELKGRNSYGDEKLNFSFFAKMPALGSDIYFEYFSTEDNNYSKSYVDFLFETEKGKIYMIEVKGYNDYNETKTNDLMLSYQQYMKQNKDKPLVMCLAYAGKKGQGKYDHQSETKILQIKDDSDKWEELTIEDFIKQM